MIDCELAGQSAREAAPPVKKKHIKGKVKKVKRKVSAPDEHIAGATELAKVAEIQAEAEEAREANGEPTFASLGVCEELCQACEQIKWRAPTKIQQEAIPWALQGRDII